jgi:signal transduction histidine kinase
LISVNAWNSPERPTYHEVVISGGARTATATAAGTGLAVTLVVALTPSLSFSYQTPIGRAILETTVTLVGALAALLCVGRYRRSRRPADVATAWAMAVLALSYPLLAALPRAINEDAGERFGYWALVCGRIAAAGLLVAAALLFSRDPRVTSARWRGVLVMAPVGIALLAIPFLAWRAPRGVDGLAPANLSGAQPLADPLVTAFQLVTAVLFALAAVGFSHHAHLRKDQFMGWLSVGAALAAVASVNYALSPSLELAWLHIGDLFRAAALVAVAVGAVQEIVSYWAGLARLARSEERRALARDLHDGLAQELAYLVSQTQTPDAWRAPPAWRRQLQSAAERALAESRRSIQALASFRTDPFETDLRRTATEAITGAPGHVDLVTKADSNDVRFAAHDRESVLRIVREALTNAVRHGHASRITITLTGPDQRTLRISDNGVGFDPDAIGHAGRGFGLISMRERAQGLGADFMIQSSPGAGTTLEVTWP